MFRIGKIKYFQIYNDDDDDNDITTILGFINEKV